MALLQKFAGAAEVAAWLRLSSKPLPDRDFLKLRSVQWHRLAHRLRPDAEGAFDKTRFAPDAGLELEGLGPLLPEGAHRLEALYRGAGRLHWLESKGRPDQALELAMVGLDDVVEVFHLPAVGLGGALALLHQLPNGPAVASRLVRVDHEGLLPLLAPAQRLAQEPLGGFRSTCWAQSASSKPKFAPNARWTGSIKRAKDRGVHFGKRPALTTDQVTKFREKREQGVLIRELMADYGLSKATIYRYLAHKDAEVNFLQQRR